MESAQRRATGRKLGITSDARYRFERGVDPRSWCRASVRDPELVLDFCGGTPSEVTVAGAGPRSVIDFPGLAEVKRLSGLDVTLPDFRRVLGDLGFFVAGDGTTVKVTVPSWRPDVEGKADLVEEAVRIFGVDRIAVRRSTAARPRAASRC